MTDWVLFRPELSGRYYELAVLLIEGVVIKQGSTVWKKLLILWDKYFELQIDLQSWWFKIHCMYFLEEMG